MSFQNVYVFISAVKKKLRFLMKAFQDLYPYSFYGLQTIECQNYSFSAASKGYKRYQTMTKVLI